MCLPILIFVALVPIISAHTAAWGPGMYCRNGTSATEDNANNNTPVSPLYNLTQEDWWFQHHRGCDTYPPIEGEFLELPANGNFTVELAHNRAFTTLSYDGKFTSAWPDGKDHPEDWNDWNTDGTPAVCLKEDGAMHTYNESSAGGTAFAISYESKLEGVTMENLVVFTTLDHTPWKRLATYQVPDLKACPEDGCHCAWLWVPNGCGQANMYMQGFKCKVTNANSTIPLAQPKAPVYCADDESKCVRGAKQMIAWNQLTGNNIETEQWTTPNYNAKCGWTNGAQMDIFETTSSNATSSLGPTSTAKVSTTTVTATEPPNTTPLSVVTSLSKEGFTTSYTAITSVVVSAAGAVSSKPCTRH